MKNIFLFSILLPLTFCSSFAFAVDKEIRIGVLTELSGPFATNGKDCRIGHETAMNAFSTNGQVGPYKVKLVYGDSRGEGKTAVTEFNKLIDQDNVQAVLLNRSQVGMPINPLSKAKKVALLGVVGHSHFAAENPYAFRFYPSSIDEGAYLAKKILEKNIKTMAAVGLQDEFLVALQDETIKTFKKAGGQVLLDERITEADVDLSSLVSKLSGAKPDLIFVNLGIGQTGFLIRKIREQGMRQPIISNFWVQKKEVIDNAGIAAIEGTGFVAISTKLPGFSKELDKVSSGLKASSVYYACHVALASALQAIRDAKSEVQDREDFYQAMLAVKSLKLLDETLPVIEREVKFTMEFSTINNGVPVVESIG